MELALQTVITVVRNKYFWLAILAVIIYVVIRKNWFAFLEASAPSFEETTKDEQGNTVRISATRLARLRELAQSLQFQIYNWYGWDDLSILDEVLYTTDAELKYLSSYYKGVLLKNKSTLYTDLDDEVLPQTASDDKILSRLQQMGLQK